IPARTLRLKPRSSAMGRKKGPMPMRKPTVSMVSTAAAATIFHPKYQLPMRLRVTGRLLLYCSILPEQHRRVPFKERLRDRLLAVVAPFHHADVPGWRPQGGGQGQYPEVAQVGAMQCIEQGQYGHAHIAPYQAQQLFDGVQFQK